METQELQITVVQAENTELKEQVLQLFTENIELKAQIVELTTEESNLEKETVGRARRKLASLE